MLFFSAHSLNEALFDSEASPLLWVLLLILVVAVVYVVGLLVEYSQQQRRQARTTAIFGEEPSSRFLELRHKKGLKKILPALKAIPFQQWMEAGIDADKPCCCICLDVYEEADRVVQLPRCSHLFHPERIEVGSGSSSSHPANPCTPALLVPLAAHMSRPPSSCRNGYAIRSLNCDTRSARHRSSQPTPTMETFS